MRILTMARVGVVLTTLVFAGAAQAIDIPTLSLQDMGGGSYYIYLTIGTGGIQSIQWSISSSSGIPDVANSGSLNFSVPQSDPSCSATGMGNNCSFGNAGPHANPGNPTGLNNYAVFISNLDHTLFGHPDTYDSPFLGPGQTGPILVGFFAVSNPGSEGGVFFNRVEFLCANGRSYGYSCLPEPTTASLLALGLIGLAIRRRHPQRR